MNTLLVVGLGCASPSSPEPSAPEPSSPEPSIPEPVVDTAGESPPVVLPTIAEALVDRCPDPTPKGRVEPAGDFLHRATVDAGPVCNDGTPPVVYVHAATDPAHEADWVLFLEGGNHCIDHETCAVRWCGEEFHDAAKMSSQWAPEVRGADGLLSDDPANAFHGWNLVSFDYCSSDRWSGTAVDVVLEGDPPFRIQFQGADILAAEIAALSAGLVSDDGLAVVPRLDAARTVLFSGSSAGGQGATVNLDRVAGSLPGVEVLGVIDAVFYSDLSVHPPEVAEITAAQRALQLVWYETWQGVMDDSCVAALGPGVPCTDLGVSLHEHTTTPFFVHHDLLDPQIYEGNYAGAMSMRQYAQAAIDTFAIWEADGTGAFLLTGCKLHTVLSEDPRFFESTTVDAEDGGQAWTVHDALAAWVDGTRVTVSDDSSGTSSTCAE